MTRFIILFVLLLNTSFISAQVTKESSLRIVQNFIHTIESGDPQAISELVHYPLRRGASTPAIGDKAEFIARFDEIFDENILKIITNSNPATDWSEVGWQGIMLLDGEIWLDYDGKLIAVNYASKTASETIHSRFQPTPLPLSQSLGKGLKQNGFILEVTEQ